MPFVLLLLTTPYCLCHCCRRCSFRLGVLSRATIRAAGGSNGLWGHLLMVRPPSPSPSSWPVLLLYCRTTSALSRSWGPLDTLQNPFRRALRLRRRSTRPAAGSGGRLTLTDLDPEAVERWIAQKKAKLGDKLVGRAAFLCPPAVPRCSS